MQLEQTSSYTVPSVGGRQLPHADLLTLDGVSGSVAKAASAVGRQAGRVRRDALLSGTA